jgi:hypothetical protein
MEKKYDLGSGMENCNKILFFFILTGSGRLRRIQCYLIESYLMCASSPRLEQMRTATASRITTAITELEIAAEIFLTYYL